MHKSKITLDEKDREILRELQKNCKQPVRKIAKKLGLRVTTTYDRIRRMEQDGIIKRYRAILNPDLVGMHGCAIVLVSVAVGGGSEITQMDIAQKISSIPGVSECHVVTGDYDMVVKIRGEDISKIGRFVINELAMIDGVTRTTTMAVIDSAIEYGDLNL